jgi:hypothetical protein
MISALIYLLFKKMSLRCTINNFAWHYQIYTVCKTALKVRIGELNVEEYDLNFVTR